MKYYVYPTETYGFDTLLKSQCLYTLGNVGLNIQINLKDFLKMEKNTNFGKYELMPEVVSPSIMETKLGKDPMIITYMDIKWREIPTK